MFSYNRLNKNQIKDEIHIKYLSSVISEYQWLINTYNVDYFVHKNWSKIPELWSNSLKDFDFDDMKTLLSNDSKLTTNKGVLPLSLLSFRATCFALQVTRESVSEPEIGLNETQISMKDKLLESDVSKHMKMKSEILNRRIKHKKRHEIARLSHLTDQLLKSIPDCNTIIDCGSGQGHLSRILSLCFGFRVISIEGDNENVSGAHNKDSNTLKSLKRYELLEEMNKEFPKKINCVLNNNSLISEVTDNCANHALIGLHACGPLSPIIINQFKSCAEAKALILVSCCYMKINEKGFPLSQLVINTNLPVLTVEAKEVACHAIEKFINKIKNRDNLDSLKVHCFRAILESLIDKFNPNNRHKPLKRVRITENMSFKEYFHKAVNGLGITIPAEELDSHYVRKCLEHEKRVIIFYCLRLLIAPLIESLILLDFMNYMKEMDIRTALFPVFDPILSPRNNVLIAMK